MNLQCCNYYHLQSGFSFNFQSSKTMFHHKLLTREGRVLANGLTRPSSMTVFYELIHKKCYPKELPGDIKIPYDIIYHI